MKNNILKYFLIFIFIFCIKTNIFAEQQFTFEVTEIEIFEEGKIFKGLKRGTINTSGGIMLIADKFEYNKETNILIATGNVKIEDLVNEILIETDEVKYLKNDEIIFTNSRSKAIGKNTIIDANMFRYDKKNLFNAFGNLINQDLKNEILITSNDLYYFINDGIISTKTKSKAIGKNVITYADNFKYNQNTNILNAQGNVKVDDKIKNFILLSNDITYLIDNQKFITKKKSEAYNDNINIKAVEFEYNKNLEILNAYKNVIIEDKINDLVLFSENITYFKNTEKIITQGKTEAIIEKIYNFKSKNPILLRNTKQFSSKFKSTIYDSDDGSRYDLNNFNYFIQPKVLKGNNVVITTNYKKEKSDKFTFSNGIFNLNEKKFAGKDTKIFLHPNIFQKEKEKFLELISKTEINKLVDEDKVFQNEPRLFGISSKGNKEKTIVKKAIFTNCKKNNSCPAWSMKSKKITHDKKTSINYEILF